MDNVKAEEYEFERWRKMMEVNLDGSWLVAREGGRYMLGNEPRDVVGGRSGRTRGSIVLVGSMSGSICVRPQKQAGYNAVCDICSVGEVGVDMV